MRYLPCWKQIGISQDRYTELLHFCRQYPEWKAEANSLLGIRAIKMDGLPHGSGKSDPTSAAAMQRERLLAKIQVVDECAKAIYAVGSSFQGYRLRQVRKREQLITSLIQKSGVHNLLCIP